VEVFMKSFVMWVAIGVALAGSGVEAEDAPRVASYTIDVTYLEEVPGIEARAEVSFVSGAALPQTLVFFLHGELWVDEVRIDGEPAEVAQDLVFYTSDYSAVARRARIDVTGRKAPETLSIRYSGKLNPSVVQAPSNYMRVDATGVFLRSYHYSIWFPTFQDAGKDTYPVDFDVTVHTPKDFVAVVTGKRLKERVVDGKRISRWRSPQDDPFNIQLTARPFELLREGGFHLYFLRDAESRATAEEILRYSARLEKFYQANYRTRGEDAQLHVVEMPRFGDISSGNMVGISERIWRSFEPASYSGRTLAHELVHPYVQIPLPRDNELYALVVEGFPSFFHLPAMAEIVGSEFYLQILKRTEDGYLERRLTGLDRRNNPLPTEKPLLALTADDIGTYKDRFVLNDRARLFCNWLRTRMGVETFGEFTRALFARESMNTNQFIALIEDYLPDSGDDLNQWLNTTEYPPHFQLEDRGTE
jgi:hypothetical protein